MKVCFDIECTTKNKGYKHATSLEDYFAQRVTKGVGCWSFSVAGDKDGYPQVTGSKHCRLAHITRANQLSYVIYKGAIPKGSLVCHTCDNPSCVNPEHLFLGTHQDNMDDKIKKGRMRGHWGPGEAYGTKLTSEDVKSIRESSGTQQSIADKYGISRPMVSLIKRHKTWKHV